MAKKVDISESITPAVGSMNISRANKELTNEKLKELMKEEGKLVKGIFQSFENPGATEKITYKKYPTPAEMRKRGSDGGLPPFEKWMTDGQEYEVPLYVARFLNGVDISAGALGETAVKNTIIGTCSYVVHGFKFSGDQPAPSQMGMGPEGQTGIPVPIIGVAKRKKRYGFQSMEFAAGAM